MYKGIILTLVLLNLLFNISFLFTDRLDSLSKTLVFFGLNPQFKVFAKPYFFSTVQLLITDDSNKTSALILDSKYFSKLVPFHRSIVFSHILTDLYNSNTDNLAILSEKIFCQNSWNLLIPLPTKMKSFTLQVKLPNELNFKKSYNYICQN